MSIRMLIDASHREETRVAIVDGNQLEDFDYESSAKKQLKGSIYLAKVTRVEPSLQAAFVDYGGNRHGFLAFSEIHPDYYQIPVADREALIAEEAAANADLLEAEEEVDEAPKKRQRRPRRKKQEVQEDKDTSSDENPDAVAGSDESPDAVAGEKADNEEEKGDAKAITEDEIEQNEVESKAAASEEKPAKRRAPRGRKPKATTKAEATKEDNVIVEDLDEELNGDVSAASDDEENTENNKDVASSEEEEEERLRVRMAKRLRYKYKIQEVIKKNQIILVQVVKEERGNKGAALTTYLSLPGRYCVLMPNTLHGGGVSRKIANVKDRKKLKNILASLNMPKGHACIIRTAGNDRTKAEIKRDYDYLKRMWEEIRDNTLKSIAPAQIYEEGNLIKRSIRDLYTKDVSEILVEGERGYNTAKNFMRLLMPSHAKKVQNYKNNIPLFQKYKVEAYLDSIYSPTAQLKSGGYIVINPTEALVSIDVNSGRATKEHNIEETALKTNLEAAEEVARQLKLRDMAGLVVIDFIDMEEQRNNRAVERKMKECLKVDRARIQVGRISSFGLMEMSRQRMRVGMLESSTTPCPHCEGSGLLRSVESQSLHILRIIEEEGTKARNSTFTVYLPTQVAIYILNNKRHNLIDLEKRYDFSVSIAIDNDLTASAFRMDKSGKPSKTSQERTTNKLIDVTEEDVSPNNDQKEKPKRRRRRRRPPQDRKPDSANDQGTAGDQSGNENIADKDEKQDISKRRRRPHRSRRNDTDNNERSANSEKNDVEIADDTNKNNAAQIDASQSTKEEKPKRVRRRVNPKSENVEQTAAPADEKASAGTAPNAKQEEKPKRTRKPRTVKKTEDGPNLVEKQVVQEAKETNEKPAENKPKKKGWWSR